MCNLPSREGPVDVARAYRYTVATRMAPTSRPDHYACDSTPSFETGNALDSIGRSLVTVARTLDFGMVCRRSRRAEYFRMDTERSDSACRIVGGEFRSQAEILAGGNEVGYRILFDEIWGPRSENAENFEMRRSQSLEELVGEIERETVRFQDLLFEVGIPALLTERPTGIAATAAPGQPWIRSIAGLVEMRCFHERHHMTRIIQWRRAKLGGDL